MIGYLFRVVLDQIKNDGNRDYDSLFPHFLWIAFEEKKRQKNASNVMPRKKDCPAVLPFTLPLQFSFFNRFIKIILKRFLSIFN